MKFIIVEDSRTYIVEMYFYSPKSAFREPEFFKEENLSMWKVKDSSNTIMGTLKNSRISDLLRYSDFYKGDTKITNINDNVIPEIKKLIYDYGLQNHCFSKLYIIKDDNAIVIESDFNITIVDELYISENKEICEAILRNRDIEIEERIRLAINAIAKEYNWRTFSYAIMDTKKEEIQYCKEEVEYEC